MNPQRIQLSRKKGFKLPPNTVVVSRPSKWGNPYKASDKLTQQKAVDLFRISLELSIAGSHCMDGTIDFAAENIGLLKGKNLACWCKIVDTGGNYVPCHADVLLALANGIPEDEVRNENIKAHEGRQK